MHGRARWFALALLLGRVAVAQPPPADPVTVAARAHFTAGIKLYDKGDYEGALVEFRAAYTAQSSPPILVNIALCLRALGRNAEAIEALEPLLPDADASSRPQIERTLSELRAKAATIRVTVVVNVPAGGRAPEPVVAVDRAVVRSEKVLQPIWLDPGTHTVDAHAAGFTDASSNVTVKAGDRDIPVQLSLVPDPATAGMNEGPTDATLEIKPDVTPAKPPLAQEGDRNWYLSASVGFFGGELPIKPELGGAQGVVAAMFVGRFGRRFGKLLSAELDGEVMGGGTREFMFGMERQSFQISHIALGAGARIVTSAGTPRFTAVAIGGVVNQKITRTVHAPIASSTVGGSPTGYLQIEAGAQIDLSRAVSFEGVAMIGMLGLNSDQLASPHTVMTRYGAKITLQFSF